MFRIICISVILLCSSARADAGERIALAPIEALDDRGADNQRIATLIAAGLAAVPEVDLIGPDRVEQAVRKARRKELRRCDGEVECLARVGELVGATRVVYGEVGGLGDARVVYLKAIDVSGARETASTTLELGTDTTAPEALARAAAFRLLAPDRYQGALALRVDVEGATVYVDGARVTSSPTGSIAVPVGTHALRVTHPEFQDFVRFVDIEFDQTVELPVHLRRYPIVSRDLLHRGGGPGSDGAGSAYDGVAPTPWYRRWYTVAGGTAVVLVGSALLIGVLTDGIDADSEKVVGP